MRKVGADHGHHTFAIEGLIQHSGDRLGINLSGEERKHGEVAEHALEERQLHLEAVLSGVHRPPGVDTWMCLGGCRQLTVDADLAQRSPQLVGVCCGHPAHRHEVRGADQDHAAMGLRHSLQQPVSAGRHRTRVDVAGVRHDEESQFDIHLREVCVGQEVVHQGA